LEVLLIAIRMIRKYHHLIFISIGKDMGINGLFMFQKINFPI